MKFSGAIFTYILLSYFALQPAFAERVLLRTTNSGQKGQGWLFSGKRYGDEACWIAVPNHVVYNKFSKTLETATYTDFSGNSGETGKPLTVTNFPSGFGAADEEIDLAFMRVTMGRTSNKCKSGLGLPSLAYRTAIRTSKSLTLVSLVGSSFRPFPVSIWAGKLDKAAGGELQLKPNNQSVARNFFKSGLSGSIAEMEYDNSIYPIAMVFGISKSNDIAKALRFDVIRSSFSELLKSDGHKQLLVRAMPSHTANQNQTVEIIGYTGKIERGSPSLTAVLSSGGCWKISPESEDHSVSVTLSISGEKGLRGLTLSVDQECGAKLPNYVIEQRNDRQQFWNLAANCQLVFSNANAKHCHLDYRTPRQIRIRFPLATRVALSSLSISSSAE